MSHISAAKTYYRTYFACGILPVTTLLMGYIFNKKLLMGNKYAANNAYRTYLDNAL